MVVPCSYYNISIASRAKGSSSVASAAYQSGERLFDERTEHQISYENKEGICHTEIMLPDHAPETFHDRNILWNSVESVEKQYNSQLARKIIAALPREIPLEDQVQLVREYCQENFVSKGMCVDFAIHDSVDGNPHVHIMLTLRPLDESGHWMPKSRKVYDLDEDGNKILLPSGYYASHKEKTTDWDEQSNAEKWRHSWEEHTNKYLEKNGCISRLDMRSYERQGVDKIPQIHMGPAVYQMEKRGIHTFIGDINRSIQKMNDQIEQIQKAIEKLRTRVAELKSYLSEVMDSIRSRISEEPLPITIEGLLHLYLKDQRGQTNRVPEDQSAVMHSLEYMKKHNIRYVPEIHMALDKAEYRINLICRDLSLNQGRINEIVSYFRHRDTVKENKDIYRQYQTQFFKTAREKFYRSHKKEIDAYRRSHKALDALKRGSADNRIPWKDLKEEYDQLVSENKELKLELSKIKKHVAELESALKYIGKVRENHPPKDIAETIVVHRTREKNITRKIDLER